MSVAILVSGKIAIKTKIFAWKEGHFIMIIGSLNQENILLKTYMYLTTGHPKIQSKTNIIDVKNGQLNNKNFKASLSVFYKNRQLRNKWKLEHYKSTNPNRLLMLHPRISEYTFFKTIWSSSTHHQSLPSGNLHKPLI